MISGRKNYFDEIFVKLAESAINRLAKVFLESKKIFDFFEVENLGFVKSAFSRKFHNGRKKAFLRGAIKELVVSTCREKRN